MDYAAFPRIGSVPFIVKLIDEFSQKGYSPDPLFLNHLEESLNIRAHGLVPENLQNTYLKDFGVPQIVLFDILANRFPLVLQAQEIVSIALIDQVKNCRNLCILDLGIGRSVQMVRLLKQLANKLSLNSVTVIGIEIVNDALDFSIQTMEKLRKELPFKLEFIPLLMPVEKIQLDDIRKHIPVFTDFFLVNASLVLHHIQHDHERKELFSTLHALQPNLFTIIEPNAATFTDDFEMRLAEASAHFCALYHYTDTLSLTKQEKNGLKTFFSNDFYDPIALPDSHRFEKLERGEEWVERAMNAGFSASSLDPYIDLNAIPNITITSTPKKYTNFAFEGTDLLSTFAFQSNRYE